MIKRLLILAPLLVSLPSVQVQSDELLPLDPANPAVTQIGDLHYLGGMALRHPDGRFGGISGLRFIGDEFIAVSDKGSWLRFQTRETDKGHLTGISNIRFATLRDAAGLKLSDGNNDAEAVTTGPDGSLLVAFERNHRVLQFSSVGAKGFQYLRPPIAAISANGGYEALTTLADGSIVGIAERNRASTRYLPGFVSGNRVRPQVSFKLARRDEFRPTDMVQMPGGDLLLLERYFKAPATVAARVSRIRTRDIRQGALVTPATLATIRQPALVDNMEGIAIRRAPDGGIWIYLVSDDNFNPLQRTILMKFAYYPDR